LSGFGGLERSRVPTLEAVDGALKLSAAFLAADPGRVAGQLTGRLIGSPRPDIGRMLDDVRARSKALALPAHARPHPSRRATRTGPLRPHPPGVCSGGQPRWHPHRLG
jgi:hypothetical protein